MSNEERIIRLETINENINSTLIRFEKRFDSIDRKFDSMDRKMESIDQDMRNGFKDMNNRLWTNFLWIMGAFAGSFVLMAHALHWF